MKAMKKKTVSKIAKGRLAKVVVMRGNKEKTVGLEEVRSDQEQERKDREQEAERAGQEEPLDAGLQEGTRGSEDQGLCCDQEGLSTLHQGKGILRTVRLWCTMSCA